MREVDVDAIPLDRLAGLLSPVRAERLAGYAERARALLAVESNVAVMAASAGQPAELDDPEGDWDE